MNKYRRTSGGFTLIELLIVAGMLAIVMAAVYSLYLTHMRSAYSQDEVVEVQQNLRIAMESLSRDIRMAGFMIPTSAPAPANTPVRSINNNSGELNSDIIELNTASATGVVGVLAIPFPGGVVGAAAIQIGIGDSFPLDSEESTYAFKVGDCLRILNPQTYDEPTDASKTVVHTVFQVADMGTSSLTLVKAKGTDPAGTIFSRGDVVARVHKDSNNPNTIKYLLTTGGTCPTGQTCLSRLIDEWATCKRHPSGCNQYRRPSVQISSG